jgi:hypothetical protein
MQGLFYNSGYIRRMIDVIPSSMESESASIDLGDFYEAALERAIGHALLPDEDSVRYEIRCHWVGERPL